MKYQSSYFDDYYDGRYEDTYHLGFPLKRLLCKEWSACFDNPPKSFADIGCGLGHTLNDARSLLPQALIYGVEYQDIPRERIVSKDIIFGDFLTIYPQLPIVDFVYSSCSMYIDWKDQEEYLVAISALTRKACCFANLYLEDKRSIPQDSLRKTIYKSRTTFIEVMESLGFSFKGSRDLDFFIWNK